MKRRQITANKAPRAVHYREDMLPRKDRETQRLREIAYRVAPLPILDNRSEEEILGYGPEGYPSLDP